jgi:hypothetical protein
MALASRLNTAPKASQAVGIRARRREEIRRLKREWEIVKQERDIGSKKQWASFRAARTELSIQSGASV